MARKNGLEVSPAQKVDAAQQVRARVKPSTRANGKDRAHNRETREGFRSPMDDGAQHEETIDAGSRYEELDSDDANDLAGLINGASLSGANVPSAKPADKKSENTFKRTYNYVAELIVGSSQRAAGSFSWNNNPMRQSATSETGGQQPRAPSHETNSNSPAPSGGDKNTLGKSLARPNTIYEDISKTQKSRRSGRPDPYEVPQSPPSSPASEPKLTDPELRGPKPKQASTKRGREPIIIASEGAPTSVEKERVALQEHLGRTEKVSDHAIRGIPANQERNARPKRVTRSTIANSPHDPEESQHQPGEHQSQAIEEPKEHLQLPSPAKPRLSIRKGQVGHQGAGSLTRPQVSDFEDFQDDLKDRFKSKTRLSNKVSLNGKRDLQHGENVQSTPTERHSEIETGPTKNNTHVEMRGISPILSSPTPVKGIHESPGRLQRPSQKPSVLLKEMQGRKPQDRNQQVTKEYPAGSLDKAKITEAAREDATDEKNNNQGEPEVRRAQTPEVIASDEDGDASFIEEKILQQLRSTIKAAGAKKDGKRMVKDDDFNTSNGRILARAATRLISNYKAMEDLKTANAVDVDKVKIAHMKALKCLEIIHAKTQIVLTDRLGDRELGGRNADKESRSNMLEDLYLHVIPDLVEALCHAVHSRQVRNALEISDLEELYGILKILHDLVKASRAEHKSIQPRAPKTNSYSISGPTRSLWPVLRKVYDECGNKLAARKMAVKAEQIRKTLSDRAKKRKERLETEEREEEKQFQQRLRERNKAIIASLNERRAELGLRPCGQPVEVLSPSAQPHASKHKAVESFDDAHHDNNGRLRGVFGSKNSHPGTIPNEWTVEEMEILVDGLRRDRGPSRYEKLATKLERTLDEIFDRAKYLKMQMEYTLKRLQEENPDKEFPPIKPWIENIGSEGFFNQ